MSLPCYRLSTLCYECKHNARHFFDKIFIKAWFCWGRMFLFCHMTSVGWWEIMIQHTPSIICNFHFPVDFRLGILFPHIFWFLHQNWVGIGWFTLIQSAVNPACIGPFKPFVFANEDSFAQWICKKDLASRRQSDGLGSEDLKSVGAPLPLHQKTQFGSELAISR